MYFEEAGQGIPVLLQHTAGSHGVQWRHLFEMPAITDHFRLIAYDLPFHGKSVPPVGRAWWTEPYRLTGAFARSVPVQKARSRASRKRARRPILSWQVSRDWVVRSDQELAQV